MNEAGSRTAGRLISRIAIALAQGGALWWLYRSVELTTWPGSDRGWLLGLITPVILVPLAHYLTADLAPDRRRYWILAPLAVALTGFGWHHGAWTTNEPNDESVSFAVAIVVLVFHALPFVQVWLAQRRWRPQYEELFHFAWRNTLLAAFGGLFCGVLWLLLWLWGALFRMIGIDFFRELFGEAYFAIPATTVAVGIGVQLAGSVERLQNVLRSSVLTMLKWLAPLAILILALFSVALVLKSPGLLLEQRRVISAAWLLWLVALTVALLNTAYQDGRIEAPYPAWLGRTIRYVVPLLLPVALLAAYALGVRIDSYGVTVARGWGALVAAVGIAYAAGYAWAALGKGAWMRRMGVVNVGVALMTVVLLSLMLSPLLSPERLAAASQYRLALQRQEADSFLYLRFDSGEYGRRRLRQLAALADHPEAEAIRGAAARALERKTRWYAQGQDIERTARDFEAFPAGSAIDPALLAALTADLEDPWLHYDCDPADPCPLLFVDLDRNGAAEALLFGRHVTGAFQSRDGRWRRMAPSPNVPGRSPDRSKLREALATGSFRVRDLGWQVLDLGGETYVFDGVPADAGVTPERSRD